MLYQKQLDYLKKKLKLCKEHKYIMEKTFDEIKKYVLENIDVLMYYDRDKLLREGAYDDDKEEGIEVGEKKKSLEIAKKMLEEKMDFKIISKLTGLPKEEIKHLQEAI